MDSIFHPRRLYILIKDSIYQFTIKMQAHEAEALASTLTGALKPMSPLFDGEAPEERAVGLVDGTTVGLWDWGGGLCGRVGGVVGSESTFN